MNDSDPLEEASSLIASAMVILEGLRIHTNDEMVRYGALSLVLTRLRAAQEGVNRMASEDVARNEKWLRENHEDGGDKS